MLRAIWRHLPVQPRRALARAALGAFAPRITPNAQFDLNAPWIVVGFLSSPSGLGQAARLAHQALAKQGETYGVDLSQAFYEGHSEVAFPHRDGRQAPARANVLMAINAPYMRYALSLLGARFVRERAILGYWVWELERAPETWREGLSSAHRIAAPSAFAARAIEALGPSAPVLVAPHPVALGRIPQPEQRAADAPFTVISLASVGSGFARKNPVALIEAFKRAFGDASDKRLRLRVTNVEHFAPAAAALREAIGGARNIELSSQTVSEAALLAWWARGAPDLYASLHRAEGFALPIAEAMCAGVPCLATDWSANSEYMTAENGYLVSAKLVPVNDPQRKYEADGNRWAEPDIDHAVALLRDAAANRDALYAKGDAARATALSRFSQFDLFGLLSAHAALRLPR